MGPKGLTYNTALYLTFTSLLPPRTGGSADTAENFYFDRHEFVSSGRQSIDVQRAVERERAAFEDTVICLPSAPSTTMSHLSPRRAPYATCLLSRKVVPVALVLVALPLGLAGSQGGQ